MENKLYYVYILSNEHATLYIGVTNNLVKRVYEHKNNLVDGFTKKYGLHTLVYYEVHGDIQEALKREKNLKHWKREWKMSLIEKMNPGFRDSYNNIIIS